MAKKAVLIVDGYNVINQWPFLQEDMTLGLDVARDHLIDLLSEYQTLSGRRVILIFDAHEVKGSVQNRMVEKGIEVVYTMEKETADSYIERFVDRLHRRTEFIVATSDHMVQQLILGRGGTRISSPELLSEIQMHKNNAKRIHRRHHTAIHKNMVTLDEEIKNKLEEAKRKMEDSNY